MPRRPGTTRSGSAPWNVQTGDSALPAEFAGRSHSPALVLINTGDWCE